MQILECDVRHVAMLAPLFDQYRGFYEQPSDPEGARRFLQANLEQRRSRVFLLLDDEGRPSAFTQLYPMVDSVAMRPFHYLSDLYVAPEGRRHGHARTLMRHVTEVFRGLGDVRLTLETARTNLSAQALYESLGYEQDRTFLTYHQML